MNTGSIGVAVDLWSISIREVKRWLLQTTWFSDACRLTWQYETLPWPRSSHRTLALPVWPTAFWALLSALMRFSEWQCPVYRLLTIMGGKKGALNYSIKCSKGSLFLMLNLTHLININLVVDTICNVVICLSLYFFYFKLFIKSVFLFKFNIHM